MEKLSQLRRQLSGLGFAALALAAAAAAFDFAVVKPLDARSTELQARVSRAAPAAAGAPADASGKVAKVYHYLRYDEQTTDWLAKLYGIGAATGVQLKSASYRADKDPSRIARYEVVLPLTGSYPQIRDFLQRALAEIPVMSLDQLTLKRDERGDGALNAELRLTLHMVKS